MLAATAAVSAVVAMGVLPQTSTVAESASRSSCTTEPNVYCSMYWASKMWRAPKYGETKSNNVAYLQRSLAQLGYPVKITANYDAQTVTWVKVYKYERNLPTQANGRLYSTWPLQVGAGVKKIHPAMAAKYRGDAVVKYAYSKIGKPYRGGATGPNAFDCSGLTQAAWKSAGKSIPRTTYAQYAALPKVSKSDLRPGDVVLFNGNSHAAIYVGDGNIIHAPRTGERVKKAPMSYMRFYGAVRPG